MKNAAVERRVYRSEKFVLLDKRTGFDSPSGGGVHRTCGHPGRKGGNMKKTLLALVGSLFVAHAWADPVKEVQALGPDRIKAFMAGDAEKWTAAYADNATFSSQLSPLRLDGKAAIRAYNVDLFNRYPGPRNLQVSQPVIRAYGDNVVVANGYYQLSLTDRGGRVSTYYARYSATWVKIDGRWQLVDQHNATLPSGSGQ
jgi:uncharacterized protein (TIGR02246 family)